MSKAILISIKPKWVAKILNREKTVEIRKKFPKDYVGWVYIYCTKEKNLLRKVVEYDESSMNWYQPRYEIINDKNCDFDILNGKVVARFWCDKVEEIPVWKTYLYANKKTCLSKEEIKKYLDVSAIDFELDENYIVGKAIHITKLEIFDQPKELWQFYGLEKPKSCNECPIGVPSTYCKTCKVPTRLTHAPQSWCFVEI